MDHAAEDWIRCLKLARHPEGGYYREIYRAPENILATGLPSRFAGPRSFCTTIIFLLKSGECSHLHRLQANELWHFYAGSPLTLHAFQEPDHYTARHLGRPDDNGPDRFCVVLPPGTWFGATVDLPDSYSLIGCTVAPGFDFADFELGDRRQLVRDFPAQRSLIEQLTAAPP